MEPTTAAAGAQAGLGMNGLFFMMIIFILVFMFLSSRGQKKRDAQQKKLISSLQKDDKVILIGGVVGTVCGFNNELIEIKVSENTKLSVLPSGIVSIYKTSNPDVNNGAKQK